MTEQRSYTADRVLERDGCRLAYRLDGPANGPLVALTHGVSLDRETFGGQVPSLADAGYRVLTWDVRGHGRSQPLGTGMSIEQVSDDLVAILDEVGRDRAVIVGQSFGGMVIQDLLDRYPDRVAAMVVVGAPALGDRPGPVMRVLQRFRVQMIKAWPDRLLRRVFAAMVTRDPQVRSYIDRATAQLDKRSFVAVSNAAMHGYLRPEAAATHDVPVLLVHGSREERPVLRAMDRWAQRDPSLQRVSVDGGHLVNQESAVAFNDVLLEFLRGHVPVEGGCHEAEGAGS